MNIQRLSIHAAIPVYGTRDAIGLDLTAAFPPDVTHTIHPGKRLKVPTGWAIAVPPGYYGRIAPRSGLASKHGIDVLAGVIDADYRGEVSVLLINFGDHAFHINGGDRIAQLIIERAVQVRPSIVASLDSTARGASGFGSTGL